MAEHSHSAVTIRQSTFGLADLEAEFLFGGETPVIAWGPNVERFILRRAPAHKRKQVMQSCEWRY